jgi:hypothetical protein
MSSSVCVCIELCGCRCLGWDVALGEESEGLRQGPGPWVVIGCEGSQLDVTGMGVLGLFSDCEVET